MTMTTPTKLTALAFTLALLVSACGGSSPTAPAPPPPANIAGGWTGTLQGTQTGGPFLVAVVMDLTQAGDSVNGTYSTASWSGTVSGTTTPTAFSGSFTFNARTTTGASCSGTFAGSGSAGGTTMTWTSPGVSGTCNNLPTSMTLAVQRR